MRPERTPSRRAGWLRGAALALACCALACRDGGPRTARHVVLVVLDATHAAHLGCYGGPPAVSPTLDGLARRGALFEQAYASATWTLPSTVSLLTGLRPDHHEVVTAWRQVPADLTLLPERLGQAGFRTASWVQMVFASARHGLDRGFGEARYVRPRDDAGYARLMADLEAWGRADPEQGRSFLYLHLRRPHSPYNPPTADLAPFETGCALAGGERDEVLRFVDNQDDPQVSPDEIRHLRHLYRANLRQVDGELARLVDALGPRLERDTLLIVTSDHGEGLGEHGDYGHGPALFEEHVRVPLLVVGPGIRPQRVAAPVATVDLMPSILELCGLPPPDDIDGRSWVPLLRGEARPRGPIVLWARFDPPGPAAVAALDGAGTSIVVQDPDGTRRSYGLRAPPIPGEPLWEPSTRAAPDGLIDMLARLARWRPDPERLVPAQEPDAATREDLRELGYLR